VPLTINDTPRRIPRFLIPLIDQAPRRRDTCVRGQVNISRQTGDIHAVQFNRVYQIFQRARVTHRPINIRDHKRVTFTTP
jgi:hypothetical protein